MIATRSKQSCLIGTRRFHSGSIRPAYDRSSADDAAI